MSLMGYIQSIIEGNGALLLVLYKVRVRVRVSSTASSGGDRRRRSAILEDIAGVEWW